MPLLSGIWSVVISRHKVFVRSVRHVSQTTPLTSPAKKNPLTFRISSYTMFYKEAFPALRNSRPDLRTVQLPPLVGAQWKQLSDSEKQVYEEKAQAKREEVKELCLSLSAEERKELMELAAQRRQKKAKEKEEEKKKKKKIEALPGLELPKKPLNVFSLFLKRSGKGIQPKSFSQMASEYNALGNDDKQKLSEEAAAAKRQYDSEMKEWAHKMVADGRHLPHHLRKYLSE